MTWDDTAPTTEELAPSSWDSAPPTSEELTPSGFTKNLGQDIKGNVEGVVNLGNQFIRHPIDTAVTTAKELPGALVNEGKRVGAGELLTGHPINAVEKLGKAFYQKPLTTGLDIGALFGGEEALAGKGAEEAIPLAEKTAPILEKEAPLAEETVPAVGRMATEAPQPLNVGEEASNILKKVPLQNPTQPTEEQGLQSFLQKYGSNLKEALPSSITNPMEEVSNYLKNQYEGAAKKPGFADTVADYLNRYAQNMSVKNLGASPLQAKAMGPESARALGKYAMENKITDPMVGDIGMEKKVADINEKAGQQIGDLRKLADTRGQLPPMKDIVDYLKSKFDPVYTKGIESGQKGSYMKALQEVARGESTHEGLADLATKLNKSATIASKLKQATGATTDIANEISRLNNQSIASFLSPEEKAAYDAALKDFGATKKIQQFLVRKGSREVAGRLGPGGGIRQLVQNFLDGYGYKAQAKIAKGMADFIKKNPSKVPNLPSLFKEFTNQIEDLGEDFSDATH